MAEKSSGGSAMTDLWWLIVIMALLGIVWFATGGPNRPTDYDTPFVTPPEPLDVGARSGTAGSNYYDSNEVTIPSAARSSRYGQFELNEGNARHEYRPGKEYIELSYFGPGTVDITGWYLGNGNDQRYYERGRTLVPGQAGVAALPALAERLILREGDRVIVTTGVPPRVDGYTVPASGFRTNLCSGYLDDERVFEPGLDSRCPEPSEWPVVARLDSKCYNFVQDLSACHIPEFKKDSEGEKTIDGAPDELSSACRTFVQQTYNYPACVLAFSGQPDFFEPEWRVFLNRNWELWAAERETITLYDLSGRVVAQTKY